MLITWYWVTLPGAKSFREQLKEHFEQVEEERVAIDIIYERGKEQGLIEEFNMPNVGVVGAEDDGFNRP